ncbi:hypothetical protein [Ralstonia chuxiongensis]|uniref:Uncharacterized protein n=1 Tax=Ralstonia chuxiongensis TaxID=2957504 RepID=A0AA41WWV4_9RALS|nr:hypothetical protein [Ralstonia chuxiongensis]MCP1174324.1 hypothetical protein [Ralstonia chuxiongensis]
MRRKLGFLLAAAFCVVVHAEEADQPAWRAKPQAYAAVNNIFAAREPFNRALLVDQAFVEATPDKGLRFWFRIFGPNYRIYSEAGEARIIAEGMYLYTGNGDTTCDLLFRLRPKRSLRIEGQPTPDGSQGGARFCPGAISLPFKP